MVNSGCYKVQNRVVFLTVIDDIYYIWHTKKTKTYVSVYLTNFTMPSIKRHSLKE